jgi:hopanoid biosynthesis associated RND transporter like protein HpnN
MILAWLVAACARHRWPMTGLAALLALGSVWAVGSRLGVSTDVGALFASSLPWKQRAAVLQRAFPQNEGLLVAVIDASQPEAAALTARDLTAALRADTVHFSAAWQPDASPYLERNAFLFLDPAKLRDLLDRTIDAQPFLGSLDADPTLRGLCAALSLLAQGVEAGQVDLTPFLPALTGLRDGLAAAASGKPVPLSWERLLAGPLADLAGRFEFVLAKPNLDFGALQPGATASQAIRDVAAGLEFVRDGSARVRLTGPIALDDEEFATVAQGAVAGLIGSAVLVTLWLFLAVRSWRAVVPVLLTVLLGLLLTSGFAALAVGTLNLVSIAFAILFVGIAVDFAIQFTVRFRDMAQPEDMARPGDMAQLGDMASGVPDLASALARTGRVAGAQILVAALATSAGFLAFTPTDFLGVAQLGLIAGVGMLIAFVCTLSFLPALLALFRPAGGPGEAGLRMAAPLDRLLVRARWPVIAMFAVLGVSGAILLPSLSFDSDPLHTKNRNTEAMRTLEDLMDDPVTNPYTMEMLAPDLATAGALAARLAKLPDVDSVLWLRSFVPQDQGEKLPMIADAAELLRATLAPPAQVAPVTADALRDAVRTVAARLTGVVPRLPAGSPLVQIAAELTRLQAAPDATLLAVNSSMTRFLPMQLDRLRLALTAVRTTEADIPPEIRRDWMTPDGRPHLQVIPKASVRGSAGLHAFVAEVQTVAPDAVGSAVTIVRSADTIVAAFRIAAVSAVAAIALILVVVLRRVLDVALVLASLLLSSLLTVCAAVLLPLPLNFANIIALPLLLGVGVSFNIYFVMNWRAGQTRPLGSATARAVVFSALSTATAFGSLALSHHPGTQSMGQLLLLSLGCTLATTMLFLPALLAVVPAPRPGGAN